MTSPDLTFNMIYKDHNDTCSLNIGLGMGLGVWTWYNVWLYIYTHHFFLK